MHTFRISALSIAALTLAACGGSGGEDPVQGVDFDVSDGVLADFEVPTAAQIAELPDEIAATINQFISVNESEILTPTMPEGEALFVGPWAMGAIDEGEALVGGTMSIDVDFDAGDEFLNGRLDVEYAFGEGGEALEVTRNPIEDFDVDINGVLVDGAISGSLSGRVDVGGEAVSLGGSLDGAFTGEGATGAIGTIQAVADYEDGGSEGFDGIFQLDRTVRD